MPDRPIANVGSEPSARTQLFTLRLWLEDLGEGRREWRGKVQHVLTGEAIYFRDWRALAAFVSSRLEHRADAQPPQH